MCQQEAVAPRRMPVAALMRCAVRQVAGDTAGRQGGPPLGRLNRAAAGAPLLAGYRIYLEGPFSKPADVASLVKAAGATLLSRPPPPRGAAAARRASGLGRTVVLRETDGLSCGTGAIFVTVRVSVERCRSCW